MFNLIPISLLITAIGGIVYIISNHLSEFSADEENDNDFKFNIRARFAEWAGQLPLDNIKSQSLSLTQKLLHRSRLILLKTDNHLMKLIGKISKHNESLNGNGKNNASDNNSDSSPDFWENLAKGKQEEIPENSIVEEPPLRKAERASPLQGGEVKINFAAKSDAAEKFFGPAKKILKIKKSQK